MSRQATVKDLRQRNRAAVLRHVVLAAETTRARVGSACHLSNATVSNVVGDLIRDGLVEEIGSLPSDGGRPIARLRVVPHGGYLLGADVGEHGVTVEIFDLTLQRLDRVFRSMPTKASSPGRTGRALSDAVASILEANPVPAHALIGIGLGVPGIVDAFGGTTTIYAQSLGWKPVILADFLSETDVPVFADNGAKTSALAEMWLGAARGVEHAAVVLVGRGIGAGIVSGGRLLRGLSSSAGEWGHTKISLGGPLCQCGGHGCLEAYAGGGAIMRRWREAGGAANETGEEGLAKLIEAADAGDQVAMTVLDETVDFLGLGLANLVNIFNPEKIVVGGWAGLRLVEARRGELELMVRRQALDRPGRQVHVEAAMLGADAVALGAALLPFEQLIEGTLRSPKATRDSD